MEDHKSCGRCKSFVSLNGRLGVCIAAYDENEKEEGYFKATLSDICTKEHMLCKGIDFEYNRRFVDGYTENVLKSLFVDAGSDDFDSYAIAICPYLENCVTGNFDNDRLIARGMLHAIDKYNESTRCNDQNEEAKNGIYE